MSTKRILILLLSLLMLLCLALSACGGEETSQEESSHEAGSLASSEASVEGSSEGESSETASSDATISNIELPSEEESSEAESSEESFEESSEESDESDESEGSGEVSTGESSGEFSEESSEETSEESTVPPIADSDPYRDNEGNYTLNELNMPPFAFQDTLFTVCVYGNNLQHTYYSEEIASGVYGTRIENYIKIRNNSLESDLGVKVQAYFVDDVLTTLLNDAMAGTVEYDAAMPFLSDAVTLGQEQLLFNLKEFGDTIHFQAPWWDQNANAAIGFEGKQYFAVGDVTFSHKKASAAVLFNKTLAYDLDKDFYTMVQEKKWTLDAMYEAGKLLAADIDGIPGMGLTDTWGTVGTYDSALYHYLASGKQIVTTDAIGVPKVTLGDATSLTTVLKIQQTLQGNGASVLPMESLQGQTEDVVLAGRTVFESGRSLFYVDTLASVAPLRKGENLEFGILPMPLHSAAQKAYHTPVMGQYAYGICIPKNVSDAKFSAYMIEALACYSKNGVAPEYEEGLLRSTNTADWDSRPMLDIIFSGMTYDLGVICGMGNADTLLSDMYRENSTTVVSQIYDVIPAIEAAVSEYKLQYQR